MKNRLRKTKCKSAIGRMGHLARSVAWFGAMVLICASALAQDLFVSANDSNGGYIYKFTWDGVRSTFASGLSNPQGLAFDNAGNLFVADSGSIYKFDPAGHRSSFASGLSSPVGLACDLAGDLFAADSGSGNIYKFTSGGAQSTF